MDFKQFAALVTGVAIGMGSAAIFSSFRTEPQVSHVRPREASESPLRVATPLEVERSSPIIAIDSHQETKEQSVPSPTSVKAVGSRGVQAHVAALISAGFSGERIAWIRRRSDELRLEQEMRMHEREQKGLGVDPMIGAYAFDDDLRLADEIGIEEYERYRQALGRPMGVKVKSVLPTSIAEQAGLQPGDEIVRYDGKRVFNSGQLVVAQRESDAPVATIEVKRDGRVFPLSIPRGPLGIKHALVGPFIFGVPPFQVE